MMYKIALISDDLTRVSLELEDSIKIYNITPFNYWYILKVLKPDFLFVESAWNGHRGSWKYKIASYPDVPRRNNHKLKKVVDFAKKLEIPTVFWNKEDGVHFERFIDSAVLFDYIFTVDENMIGFYKEIVDVPVDTLMFAIQPKIHSFSGFNFKYKKANFVGSYSRHIHSKRREWQDMALNTLCNQKMDIDIYNRNSDRNPKIYGYPKLNCTTEYKKIPYDKTAQVYKDYMISLNVNTVIDSPTMFSRRLIEILVCGGICVTNNSLAVDRRFKDFVYIVSSSKELSELIDRFQRDGLNSNDYDKIKAGVDYVMKHHTWDRKIKKILNIIDV